VHPANRISRAQEIPSDICGYRSVALGSPCSTALRPSGLRDARKAYETTLLAAVVSFFEQTNRDGSANFGIPFDRTPAKPEAARFEKFGNEGRLVGRRALAAKVGKT